MKCLNGIKQFIQNYWLSISLGMILTEKAVELAYAERGYLAFGSEYFVAPIIVITAYMAKQIIREFAEILSGEE